MSNTEGSEVEIVQWPVRVGVTPSPSLVGQEDVFCLNTLPNQEKHDVWYEVQRNEPRLAELLRGFRECTTHIRWKNIKRGSYGKKRTSQAA